MSWIAALPVRRDDRDVMVLDAASKPSDGVDQTPD
jgi:hypothetical protein